MLKFGLCRCVLPYAPVLTQHTFTLTCTFTHTCAHNTALTPNTSHSHSLPDQEPKATRPLTSRLPTEATGQATGFYLHSRPLWALQLQGQRLPQPTAPILPSQENRLSRRVWVSKLKAIAPPHSFLPWSMEKNPFAASNLKNERKEKKLECKKSYLAIPGLNSPHKSRPLFPSLPSAGLTTVRHLGRPIGAILVTPLPGSL